MDDNNTILKDLGELVENTKSAVKAEFSYEDVSLSGGFKKAFAKNIASGGNTIEYLKSTAIITTSAGLKIYLPNQWFVLATYPVELIKEIIKYRNYTEKVIDSNAGVFVGSNGKALEKKEIYKNLKSTDGIDFSEKFKQIMKDYLLDLGQQEDIANQNCELLYKFVSNDKWWLGGKGIERTNDFYVSPILSVLNLVNASQSYVATITYAYVNDANLYAELETITDADEECSDSFEDEYRRAAKIITDYVSETGFEIPCSRSNIETAIREFQERFSPEKLAAIEDENLLTSLFYTVGDNTEALCCWLEHNADCREYFGSIAGGSAYKFGLFQKKDTGEWMTGSPQKPEVLSEEQALEIGKTIRDALVKGVDIINNAILDNLSDFEKLDEDLKQGVGEQYYNLAWFHKYFSLICPEKLSGFHSNDWQTHVLRCLRISPSEKYYARSAQLAKIENYAGMYYREFFAVVFEEFGGIKHFVRIGTKDDEKNYVAEWQQKSVVGIGWRAIGSLQDYVAGDGIDKDAITEKMMEEYFHDDKKTASRKAGELARFYKTNADTVFVAMNGEKLIAFVDEIGEYFYDASTAMAHMKAGKWHNKFADGDTLPDKSEGKLTSCYQLTNNENLMFLYEKYYYGEEAESEELDNSEAEETYMPLVFNTEIKTEYEFEIIGIFSGKRQEKYTGMTSDFSENMVFIDYESSQTALNKAENNKVVNKLEIFSDSSEDTDIVLNKIKEIKIDWSQFNIEKDDGAYEETLESVSGIKHIIKIMTYLIMAGGIIVLSLILILWLRERIYEIGILLSIGISKAKIITQFIFELIFISLPSIVLSLFLGNVILNQIIGGFINSDNSTININNLIKNDNLISNITTNYRH